MEPSIKISSKVNSFEIVSKNEEAIRVFFPSWMNNEYSENIEKFPSKRAEFTLIDEIDSLEIFFQKIREQKILDTAFDVMTINLENDKTNFSISRQSALSGKISFILGDKALGGTIDIFIQKQELGSWLEQQTWHIGRNMVPRSIGDEYSMNSDGEPNEWFENY
mgnify:CR=1 FL=1